MAEEFNIDPSLNDKEKYLALLPQIRSLIDPTEPAVSNLANLCALLYQSFDKISWAGFYLTKNGHLFLGPFQGKVACTQIEFGKGVCGAAAKQKETIIVANVNEFPGHIACDSESNSEIVVPIIRFGECVGVLDLDSYKINSFSQTDKVYLEQISEILAYSLDISKLI